MAWWSSLLSTTGLLPDSAVLPGAIGGPATPSVFLGADVPQTIHTLGHGEENWLGEGG